MLSIRKCLLCQRCIEQCHMVETIVQHLNREFRNLGTKHTNKHSNDFKMHEHGICKLGFEILTEFIFHGHDYFDVVQ